MVNYAHIVWDQPPQLNYNFEILTWQMSPRRAKSDGLIKNFTIKDKIRSRFKTIDILATFENDPSNITDVRELTGFVTACSCDDNTQLFLKAARQKGCWIKILLH